jgi:hypothetical protein
LARTDNTLSRKTASEPIRLARNGIGITYEKFNGLPDPPWKADKRGQRRV